MLGDNGMMVEEEEGGRLEEKACSPLGPVRR